MANLCMSVPTKEDIKLDAFGNSTRLLEI